MKITYESTEYCVSSIPKGECFCFLHDDNNLYIQMEDNIEYGQMVKVFDVNKNDVSLLDSGVRVKPVEAKIVVDND